MIFVDTGAWFALFVSSDPHHAAVRLWFDANTLPLITSDYCIDETLTLLVKRGRHPRAIAAEKQFFHANLSLIHYVSADQIQRAWILFQQRAAAGWSFTDCTSKVVIDDLNISATAALDDHFRQFGAAIVP